MKKMFGVPSIVGLAGHGLPFLFCVFQHPSRLLHKSYAQNQLLLEQPRTKHIQGLRVQGMILNLADLPHDHGEISLPSTASTHSAKCLAFVQHCAFLKAVNS